MTWFPISTAPTDGRTIIVYAPGQDGLNQIVCLCAWHPDAGFCVDELREPTHWQPFESPTTDPECQLHDFSYSHSKAGMECSRCGEFVSDFL